MGIINAVVTFTGAVNDEMQAIIAPALRFSIQNHETVVNFADIASFCLVTPELLKQYKGFDKIIRWIYLARYASLPLCTIWTIVIFYKAINKTRDQLHISPWWLLLMIPGLLQMIGFVRVINEKSKHVSTENLNKNTIISGSIIFLLTRVFAIICAFNAGARLNP